MFKISLFKKEVIDLDKGMIYGTADIVKAEDIETVNHIIEHEMDNCRKITIERKENGM